MTQLVKTDQPGAIVDLSLLDFGRLTVLYDSRVLRPRQWTLAQSEWSAALLQEAPDGPVLELCAGVGHIGLAAVAAGRRELVQVDLNAAACELARRNADAALMGHRVEIREGRMDEAVGPDEKFALIIADPPWVRSEGIGAFPEDPAIAIDGGIDGLDLLRTCCDVIDTHLAEGGSAVIQLGTIEQVQAIGEYLEHELGSLLHVLEVRTFERGMLALVASQPSSGHTE
ncbi:MAG: methyltransferase [Aeromicrobium sp.]